MHGLMNVRLFVINYRWRITLFWCYTLKMDERITGTILLLRGY